MHAAPHALQSLRGAACDARKSMQSAPYTVQYATSAMKISTTTKCVENQLPTAGGAPQKRAMLPACAPSCIVYASCCHAYARGETHMARSPAAACAPAASDSQRAEAALPGWGGTQGGAAAGAPRLFRGSNAPAHRHREDRHRLGAAA